MIPGPVTGRTAVDPNAAQKSQADSAGEGVEGGASFADLLAAMLAPGAAGQLQPAATAPAEAVFDRLDAAEMFNETGLFRGAAPLPATGAAAIAAAPCPDLGVAAPAPGARAQLQVAGTPLRGAAPPGAPAQVTQGGQLVLDTSRGGTPAAAAAATTRPAYRAQPAFRGQPAAAPVGAVQSPESGSASAGVGRSAPRAATKLVQAWLARAASAPAQVSVQAVEGGISVVARADRLTREERDRLRVEIAELLARHGFAVADMVLNGEAWPLPKGRDE